MDQPGTRIQWGQALVVLSMIVLSWWTATQWTAWELAFQPELGRPWFTVLHRWPVYAPPLFFWWWYEFDAYAPAVFARGAWIAGSGGVLAFMAAVALSVHRAREAKRAATYGSARWAEDAEIRAAGLLGEDGVVLGKYRRAYLRHDGPEHVLIFAPTRTGKGVGMVVPTLLTWPGSAIIHDIKGENWQITAGFRNRFGRVLLFDPTNPVSSAYNPLLEVRRGASEVRDVQNIADILVDPEGSLERRNHWEKTSHALLVGAILHVLYAEDDKTLAGVAKFLSDPKRSIEATLSAMMRTPDADERREAAMSRRLDRLDRQVARMERDLGISLETLALFIRYWMTVSPPLPEPAAAAAARAQGAERYEAFLAALGRRLSRGPVFRQEIPEDVPPASES
ncbi:type IV secretory system conjugative DNA transfer family protein [Novacetimonas hansenii]